MELNQSKQFGKEMEEKNQIEANIQKFGEETRLDLMIVVTNYIKYLHHKKGIPIYSNFKKLCEEKGMKVVEKEAFDFAYRNIYRDITNSKEGLDEVYLLEGKIVKGLMIKDYGGCKLWLINDYLILACPTNFELMKHDMFSIFRPVLGSRSKFVNF